MAEIQDLIKDYPFSLDENGGMMFSTVYMMANASGIAPGYWSPARDEWLKGYYRKIDALNVANNNFISKAVGVPFRIFPVNRSIQSHTKLAEDVTYRLLRQSGLMRGFTYVFKQFILSYLTQDNGAFALILGNGPEDGPIIGKPSGIIHLDSSLCERTSNPEFPIKYYDKRQPYKIHYTRLISVVNMPSDDLELNGVGTCAVSSCLNASQELFDMMVYSQEKLGSRPARQILYSKTGATIKQLTDAIKTAEHKLDNQGLSRFAKTLLLAPMNPSMKLELDVLDLASSPDGFERQSVTLLDMALVASSYGLDLRDLAFSFGISGQTRSDAEVQHLKGFGKGVGQFLTEFEQQIRDKFLPEALDCSFDNVDDSQDERTSRISAARATARSRDIAAGIITVRVSRIKMLREGEITQSEFEELELADGRLAEGTDVRSLFYSQDPLIVSVVSIPGVTDPTDLLKNQPGIILPLVRERLINAWKLLETASTDKLRYTYKACVIALEKLSEEYEGKEVRLQQMNPTNLTDNTIDVTNTSDSENISDGGGQQGGSV